MTTDVTVRGTGAAIAEQVIVKGDLAKLSEAERMSYYGELCRSLGLNPLTRPFEYIVLNGKMTLYATRGAGDQLRATRGITITGLDPREIGDLYVVVATGRDREGREDSATGAVAIKGLSGEALANAMMKAETKAKRRLTLSLAGLGFVDESEVGSIPGAARVDVDPATGEIHRPSLAERVEARRAEVTAPVDVIEGEVIEEGAGDAPANPAPEMTALEAHRRFIDAAKAAGTRQAAITAAARQTWGAIPSTEYTAAHWIGLSKALLLEI